MMYYYYNGKTYDDARTCAEELLDCVDESAFDEMLDDCYEEVKICGYEYSPSQALEAVDPVAYRCAFSDWKDAEASDIEYELEHADDGEELEFYGEEVVVTDVELEDLLDDDEIKELCRDIWNDRESGRHAWKEIGEGVYLTIEADDDGIRLELCSSLDSLGYGYGETLDYTTVEPEEVEA